MIRVNYHLTDGQVVRLKSLSERTGLSVAELIRRAVDDMLRREAKRAKEGDEDGG